MPPQHQSSLNHFPFKIPITSFVCCFYKGEGLMSSKRVSFLTFNSLTSLSKVRCSQHFSDSFTYFYKLLSTATERWDFHSLYSENSSYYTPNPIVNEQKQNGLALNPNGCMRNPVGDNYHKYSGDLWSTANQKGAVSQTGNFDGCEETNRNLQISPNGEQSSKGFHQNHDGMHWESTRNELQNNSVYVNGTFRNNSNMQNVGGSFWKGPTGMRQNQIDLNLQRFLESQGSLNENHVDNNWQFQQSQSDQHGPNFSQYQQNPQDICDTNSYGQVRSNANSYGQVTSNANSYGQVTSNANSYGYVSATSNPEGDLTELSQTSSKKDTVELLDQFCNKQNVKEAVEVLMLMEKQGVHVDLARILQLMKACGEVKALQEAKTVHEHLIRSFSPLQISIYNRILEMYSKCGSMDDAFDVFDKMLRRNLTSWDTMITWLAKNGLGEDALDLFSQFKKAGLKPDAKMFIGVFSACGVVGDINEGMLHFTSMSSEYSIVPSMEHFVGVVDMLGSAGHLDEALEFIEKMPFEPSVDIWETLMNLCRVHGNLEMGDLCAELVEQLDPSRLNEQSKLGLIPLKDSDLKQNEKKKLASQSPLEVRSRVHEYRAGDTSHPENDRIYALLRSLKEHMKEAGYIPETRFVLHDIDQESKEEALLAHSERLALANGLLTTPARGQIRIIKNLRVCGDCHAAFKIMSKIVGREIIMRDAKRFHHFIEGLCSCRDYW
ncbi:pentatricopeptide repeat-containing protein At4g32450, mitochondrial-like [Durio zibethinus]|uniref:Pentatricopeptide repeat-containing protein At4g32450, mitochondrial-like n=1 Tax=Durio zibethinus TaxID=66656 RepID=A0A6P6ACN1_DURZI|nr:pentatricopeptide repeat-containing protein At4g32450, mitochondrial-like [Durio zibethinus]